MILVKRIINAVKTTSVSQLAISRDDEKLFTVIDLAIIELFKRFNLNIEYEIVNTNPNIFLYELKNKDIDQVIAIYDSCGKELCYEVSPNSDYDYKQVTYRKFILNKPKDERLIFIYKAIPNIMVNSLDDEIDIPLAFIGAIVDYIAYRCHSTISQQSGEGGPIEADVYYKRFELSCQNLINEGYQINLFTAKNDIYKALTL